MSQPKKIGEFKDDYFCPGLESKVTFYTHPDKFAAQITISDPAAFDMCSIWLDVKKLDEMVSMLQNIRKELTK